MVDSTLTSIPDSTPAAAPGVRSEVGPLQTVLLHRPGNELRRLTPRNNDDLLFDAIPWVDRAQEEHDAFAELLTGRGVEVLRLTDLLTETWTDPEARRWAIAMTCDDLHMGAQLQRYLTERLADLSPAELTEILVAGLRNDEVTGVRTLVTALKQPEEFVINPLPNLLFTRDSSTWVGDRPVVTSLAMPARARETRLTGLLYDFHPRFAGLRDGGISPLHGWDSEHLEGGDVLALAEGVLAVGVGERTSPAGVERLARAVFELGLIRRIVVVPIDQRRATMHLDTICTMVDTDTLLMYPNVADTLTALEVRPGEAGDLVVGEPGPFLEIAAAAMGIDRLHLIDTGLDPVTAEREQWDDGNNTLALAPRVAVAYERNTETNARLEDAGIEVLRIAGSELGSGRGGPRCMSCPIVRTDLGNAG
ncbi:arginine deiminase [Enemella evansiae]|uniref:arginine deiminase n=1 Tax=Enemella evansiae TaxID=2016499 RepID=UPI000B964462|nr:arginine deiminase [Enemella evansiae]OYO16348.1 arginine deiminase [Enemella evansiae]TDO91497.1 arginine deiminase [Enemella evansiae]